MKNRHGTYVENYQRDLRVKNYSELTIKNYSCQIWMFLNYFNASQPKDINQNQIKDYLTSKVNINSRKHTHSALKLFYRLTIGQHRKFAYIEYARKPQTEPILLSQEEIQRMFDVCENKKHLAILATLFSTGIRRQELIDLKLTDFDKGNRVIYIQSGKGGIFRKVPYNEVLRKYLEPYYRKYHPQIFLFENPNGGKYSPASVLAIIKQIAIKAGISKRAYTHLIRHNVLTALCEQNENLETVKEIAGHKNVSTLSTYIHLSSKIVANVKTPLNNIIFPKRLIATQRLRLPA